MLEIILKYTTSATGMPGTFGEVIGAGAYTVANNVVIFSWNTSSWNLYSYTT
jgi:hypothetical protein